MAYNEFGVAVSVDWQDVGLRAVKTFVQAALAALVLPIGGGTFSLAAWKAPVLAAVAAGISAAWNIVAAEVKIRRG